MVNMTRSLCLRAEDLVRRTLPVIGLVFVLGSTAAHAGLSPPQPLTTYERLVSKEIPDSLILSLVLLSETTTSPSLRSPSSMVLLSKGYRPQNQNGIVVNNFTGHGSMSSAHLNTSTTPMTVSSSRCVLKTPASSVCSKSLQRHPSQGN